MKKYFATSSVQFLTLFVCLGLLHIPARAGETSDGKTPAEEAPVEYLNWITLGLGGVSVGGDEAQFQQRHWTNSGWFGGIEDMHWEPNINKDVTFKIDGHAMIGLEDYLGSIELSYRDVGYVKAGYRQYRTWYDGNGGFFPGNNQFFDLYNNDFSINRSNAWIELGLRVPKWPEITFRYEHDSRTGQKDSTIWGDTSQTGLPPPTNVRNIVPTFLNIDEARDIFTFDLKHTISITDIGVGVRYETQDNEDSRNVHRRPGEAADRFVTQRENISADLFSAHAFSETRWNDKIHFTMAYMFTTLNSDMGGSRIYGASYDPVFDPVYPRRQQRDEGFLNLMGGSQLNQHVTNLNFWWSPWKDFVIVPALRYEHNELDSVSNYIETNVLAGPSAVVQDPLNSQGQRSFENVTESLELRYNGLKNWAFYARGEWLQEDLYQAEQEFETQTGNPIVFRQTNGDIFTQKYVIGTNWYPRSGLNFAGQYYRKTHDNEYSHPIDSTLNGIVAGDRYPAYFLDQDFVVDDVNFRVTWRPWRNFTTVTRYDFQQATVDTRPEFLGQVQSSEMTSHILSESITWNPTDRLYLQASIHYVQNQTDTPAAEQLPGVVQNAENNYWNGTFSAGYALNDKTDLQLNYFYYRADNFENNSAFGQPYNSTAEENSVTVMLTREFTKNIRGSLKYGYFSNRDATSGGNNDYTAHLVAATLQYRY